MAAASGGLLFINGLGAIAGPLAVGWTMGWLGPQGFWAIIAVMMLGLALYALWRMRAAPARAIVGDRTSFAPLAATATSLATGAVQEAMADGQARGAGRH
jgi:hypothetical protein